MFVLNDSLMLCLTSILNLPSKTRKILTSDDTHFIVRILCLKEKYTQKQTLFSAYGGYP